MSYVEHHRGCDGGLNWEFFQRAIPEHLRPFVRELNGYSESTPGLLQRREFSGGRVVLIFEFGPRLRVFSRVENNAGESNRFARGFVAGIDEAFTLTEHDGFQSGIQINFTPPGARLFFGLPMSELSGQVTPFEDLIREERDLAERLYDLGHWAARFDLLEDLLTRRIFESSGYVNNSGFAAIDWAFGEIERSGGRLDVADLARELSYSQKHLIHLFHQHVGVAPRLLGRVVRFQKLVEYLRGTDVTADRVKNWAAIAVQFGYYDQSHLIREMKAFTGRTPTRVHEILQPSFTAEPDILRRGLDHHKPLPAE